MKIQLNFGDEIEEYNRKTIDYGNGTCEMITYHHPRYRCFRANHTGINQKPDISDKAQEERTRKQMYAIRRTIKGYALANSFHWFVTLTINPKKVNSFDYNKAKNKLLRWCRSLRNKYGKFDYLIVPELHKSGAIHFHALFGDIPANFVEAKHSKTQQPIIRNDRQVYNLEDWRYGFSECEKIEDKEKTASYLTKYVTKELMTDKTMYKKKRYFNSKGLIKPKISFEMKDNSELRKFTPNYAIIDTNSMGENVLDIGIYKLATSKETGELVQIDTSYLYKAKNVCQQPSKDNVTDTNNK